MIGLCFFGSESRVDGLESVEAGSSDGDDGVVDESDDGRDDRIDEAVDAKMLYDSWYQS